MKSSPHLTEENALLRSIKYFDLGDTGRLNKRQFVKAMLGLGIASFTESVGSETDSRIS